MARGVSNPQKLFDSHQTIEGLYTAKAAVELADTKCVQIPIMRGIKEILYDGVTLNEAIRRLVNRALTSE